MSSGSIRIIQLPEKSSVNTDDYMAVDSSANGTKKIKFTDLLDDNLSAQNKAADAQATGEAISELNTNINNTNTRIDNMINTQQNASVTTLWTGSLNAKNQTATLSESIANFDFIDIYIGDEDTVFARKPVSSSVHFEIQTQNMSDDASVQFLRWYETGLTISGTTATIDKAIRCYWDDFSTQPVVAQAIQSGITIIRIDGVKIGHIENDEIIDARVGANGITYSTLGDAIRGQIIDVKSDIDDIDSLLYTQRVKTSLEVENIGHYNINSSGVLVASGGYDTFVINTSTYKTVDINASTLLKIVGYFSDFPVAGSQTINGSRVVDDARGIRVVPSACNYIVICLTSSASSFVTATNGEVAISEQIDHITPQMTTFATGGEVDPDGNLLFSSMIKDYYWVNTALGSISETSYSYCCSGYIEIESGEDYTWCSLKKPYCYGFYDEDYVTTGDFGTLTGKTHVTAPANAKYIAYAWSGLKVSVTSPMIIKGTTPVSTYEEPTITKVELLNSDYATKEYVDSHGVLNVSLELPTSYELVVGDTFELFWKGVINAVDYENFFVKVICDIGKNYTRKFECTPIAGDVGTHQCKISLYNNYHSLIVEKTIDLIVKAKATSPVSEKVVLYVGDSLANSGYVPDEFNRRLVGSSGTPAGDGLSNLIFIGNKESVDRQIKYVGNGGWTWASYNSSMATNAFMWITANAHGKTSADQHSVYEASNGTQWKLETIEENRIKIIRTSGSSALPSTGTLTWVSGGNDHANIVYTASEQAAGNPFWDEDTSAISFANFASEQGVSQIDYIYVLLGWNSTGAEETTFKQNVRTFLDNVLSDYANCKIVLLGLQIPARDGLAYNYGQNAGVLSDYQQSMQYVFNLNKWYYEISQEADYVSNVSFVNIAGQFDTEYNMPTRTGYYNTRNTESFRLQYNGVHPAQSGYYQIADACYRDFVHKLQI